MVVVVNGPAPVRIAEPVRDGVGDDDDEGTRVRGGDRDGDVGREWV